MKSNININKISFGNNALFQKNIMTDSCNYIEDDIKNINNNGNINMNKNQNQMDEFKKQLYEYEQKSNKYKKEQKHFDFKGGLFNDNSTQNNKGVNVNGNTLINDNNINNPNNNNMNNILNNDSEFNKENYDEG